MPSRVGKPLGSASLLRPGGFMGSGQKILHQHVDRAWRHSSYQRRHIPLGFPGAASARAFGRTLHAKDRRPIMKRFFALFQIPASVMEDWKKNTPPDQMKAAGEKMMG